MKLLAVTRKDLLQSSRSLLAITFMFGVPIFMTGLFYFIFGGTGDDQAFELPQTQVSVANLDTGQLPTGLNFSVGDSAGNGGAGSLGDLLVQVLQTEALREIIAVTVVQDEAAARDAVDDGQAGVALIIPEGFTGAALAESGSATITLVHDPGLTLGPAIVEGLVRQIVDSFAAPGISLQASMEQLTVAGLALTPDLVQALVSQVTEASLAQMQGGAQDLLTVQPPGGAPAQSNTLATILSVVMSGMTVFFSFFTGSATMISILQESEQGTLARLFTTPTPIRTILGGKFLAVVVTLVVQIIVLLAFGSWVFGIQWGPLLPLSLVAAGLVLLSGTMGLFLVSIMENTRQSGVMFGAVLTMTGMVGMIPTFTGGEAALPTALQVANLLVPQGWVIRGLNMAMKGADVPALSGTLAAIAAWSLAFALIGGYRLARRFA